jgi:hypothetical protein
MVSRLTIRVSARNSTTAYRERDHRTQRTTDSSFITAEPIHHAEHDFTGIKWRAASSEVHGTYTLADGGQGAVSSQGGQGQLGAEGE